MVRLPDHAAARTSTARDFILWLEEAQIETRLVFAGNILKQPGFRGIPRRVHGELTGTDTIMNQTLFIGVYPGLTAGMLEFVVERIGLSSRTRSGPADPSLCSCGSSSRGAPGSHREPLSAARAGCRPFRTGVAPAGECAADRVGAAAGVAGRHARAGLAPAVVGMRGPGSSQPPPESTTGARPGRTAFAGMCRRAWACGCRRRKRGSRDL